METGNLKMNNTLPKYIGVIAEPGQELKFFSADELGELMQGEYRSEVNRVESLKLTQDPVFPVYVSVLAVANAAYRFFAAPSTREARVLSGQEWAQAVMKYEASGGNRTDSGSPVHDTFSWNSELGYGRFWRIYTEYLGPE